MRGRLAAGLGVLVVAGFAPNAAEAARSCPPAGSSNLAATRDVHVFRDGDETYACHERSRKGPYLLADADYDESIKVLRIAGRYVGYSMLYKQLPGTAVTRVVNVRRGAQTFYSSYGGYAYITDLELGTNGWVAVITRLIDGPGLPRYEVSLGTNGAVLDEGMDIDPRSLVLRGRTLYWTRGSQRRAPLRPFTERERYP